MMTGGLIILISIFVMIGASIFMLIMFYPYIFYPVRANIYTRTKGGFDLKKDIGKFTTHKTLGPVIQFHKHKDMISKQKKFLSMYKDEHFVTTGNFLPKKHINIFQKNDGTWHPMPLVLNEDDALLTVDLRDVMGEFVAEQDNIIATTQNKSFWSDNKGMISILLTGLLIIGIIALGTNSYMKIMEKRAGVYVEMLKDPDSICKSYYAPFKEGGEKMQAVEGVGTR